MYTSHKKHQNGCKMREETARKGLCLLRGLSVGVLIGCAPKKDKNPKKASFHA
jgi:hypothetical protein